MESSRLILQFLILIFIFKAIVSNEIEGGDIDRIWGSIDSDSVRIGMYVDCFGHK